jgi:CheY-like chemotaxis protein
MARPRILLIDDEVALTDILKINLEDTGRYEVRVENRGGSAVAAARAFKPDLVFLDVLMPDMDGGAVAAALREDPQFASTPIVYLTAIVSKQEVTHTGGLIGGNPFIAKPVSLEEAVACIERYLGADPSVMNGSRPNLGGVS